MRWFRARVRAASICWQSASAWGGRAGFQGGDVKDRSGGAGLWPPWATLYAGVGGWWVGGVRGGGCGGRKGAFGGWKGCHYRGRDYTVSDPPPALVIPGDPGESRGRPGTQRRRRRNAGHTRAPDRVALARAAGFRASEPLRASPPGMTIAVGVTRTKRTNHERSD